MKFDFSDDLKLLREQGCKFLQEHSPPIQLISYPIFVSVDTDFVCSFSLLQ